MKPKTAVLILASKDHTAWAKSWPDVPTKQLLVINPPGETVIARIIRQCGKRGAAPIVISHVPAIIAEGRHSFTPSIWSRGLTCLTLLSTMLLWKERTIVLLGDVIFSKDAMDQVFAYKEDYGNFGDNWETYGISFRKSQWLRVAQTIMRTVELARDGTQGSLEFMWKVWCGSPFKGKKLMNRPDWIHFHDWTMDIDMYHEWENFNKGVVDKGKLDDLP